MASCQSLKSEKSVRKRSILLHKSSLFRYFFFKFWRIAISRPVEVQELNVFLKKPYHPMFERSFEIGRILAVKGSRLVLLEVVRGHPQGDAPPNFFPVSKCSILGLSNEVSFVSWSVCKHGENQEKEKSITTRWLCTRVCGILFKFE